MNHPLVTRLLAVGALALGLVILLAGATSLPGPPLDIVGVARWWAATDPALAIGGLLRTIAGIACAYLLAVTVLDLVATAVGSGTLAHVARRAAPAAWRIVVLRPLTAGTLAVPVVMGPLMVAQPAMAAPASHMTVDVDAQQDSVAVHDGQILTMTLESEAPTPPTTELAPVAPTTVPPTVPAPTTTVPPLTAVPQADVVHPEDLQDHTQVPPGNPVATPPAPSPAPPGVPPTAPVETPGTAPESPAPTAPAPTVGGSTTYVVVPGDSFWRIAAVRVEATLGRVPTPQEIHGQWRALIDANVDRLAVPGNPDLIFPGDVLVLPDLG